MTRIKVSSAKAKGRWLQDWVAKRIGELLNLEWGHEDYHLIEPRPMGQAGTDVILRGKARDKFPFGIECKSGQNIGWQAAVRQARENAKKGKYEGWLLFLKTKEFQKPIVMFDAETFFRLMERNIEDIETLFYD